MYYVEYLVMIASYLKPNLNSMNGSSKFSNHKRLFVQKKNQDLVKPLLVSMFFLLCIILVPEKPSNLASICEKYNSSLACQVW
jgi:flagellar biosynthesis protein FlhB